LHMRWQPRFVPVTDVAGAENLSKYSDEATGVVQRRLSNGICVNYKVIIDSCNPSTTTQEEERLAELLPIFAIPYLRILM
jgi:hypothetical protein